MRERVGATVELTVGQPLLLEHHSHLTGSAPGLRLDQLVQTYRDHAISSFMISFAPA